MSKKQKHPEVILTSDHHGTPVLIRNGVKIAECGQPGSPQAREWVVLERGYTVHGGTRGDPTLVVEYNGVRLQ